MKTGTMGKHGVQDGKESVSAQAQRLLHSRWAEQVTCVEPSGVGHLPKNQPFIVTATGLEAAGVIEAVNQPGVTSVVQPTAEFTTALNTAALMKCDPTTFLEHPVSSIFDPVNAGAARDKEIAGLSIEFRSATERNAIRMQIAGFLAEIVAPEGVRENIFLISDELISNVIFNAPYQLFGDDTNPGIAMIAPKDTLPTGMSARIFLAAHGDSLVIGCEDQFGSMNIPRVLKRLDRCYFQGVDRNIRWNGRGAGIGLFLVMERSSSFFLGVNAMFKTLVCSQISLLKSERARISIPKAVHWLETEP